MQQKTNIINLRQLLDKARLVIVAIQIILFINLLKQFQTTILLAMFESFLNLQSSHLKNFLVLQILQYKRRRRDVVITKYYERNCDRKFQSIIIRQVDASATRLFVINQI